MSTERTFNGVPVYHGMRPWTKEEREALDAMPENRLTDEDISRMAAIEDEKRTEGHAKHKIPNYED